MSKVTWKIRMSKEIRTPKENREIWWQDKINIAVMMNKFLYTRYKFLGETFSYGYADDNNWGVCVTIWLDTDVYISIYGETSALVVKNCTHQLFPNNGMRLPQAMKSIQNYKEEYWNIMEYFADVENIVLLKQYCADCYDFLYTTTYLPSLPLAYTFLLCNKTKKLFPKEIAKLIAHKLLFFLPPNKKEKNEKEKREKIELDDKK